MMATEFFIHKMSEHMETARIIRWLVKEGERVDRNQVIMEVETDKAVVEMEAPAGGVIRNIRPDALDGSVVRVGETICWIAGPGEVPPPIEIKEDSIRPPAPKTSPSVSQPEVGSKTRLTGEVRATPVARRVAKDLGVDLALVTGSGPNGIIRDEDVRAYAEKKVEPVAQPESVQPTAGPQVPDSDQWVDLSRIQALTGQRMLASVRTAPQFSLMLEADMTNFLWLQEALAERVQAKTGGKLSVTALLVKIIAETLKHHPLANASYEEKPGGQPAARLHAQINIGVALGTENGLVVPVIRQADQLSLEDVAARLSAYIEQAKTMRFAPTDLDGGTFTLSNLGMYGIHQFNAILNPPQSAILAVGKIVKRAVELPDGGLGLRPVMNLTLTVDHRVMDGLQGARFLADLQSRLEKPYFLLS
ncbi:MAG: 2-oxo acid dehydrogenase subunit E2 [Chloroflexi bacterium]|nr:MAG: 2-oxo acid dehydrogenase subunit E2 [Chloroflexota bacterium]